MGAHASGQTQRSQSLNDEARAVAQRFWNRTLKKCGDSYYYYLGRETNRFNRGSEAFEFHIENDAPLRLFQLRDLAFYVSEDSLSEANLLNKVQWSGSVHWRAAAMRDRSLAAAAYSGSKKWGSWSEWKSSSDDIGDFNAGRVINSITLLRKNDQWDSAWRAGGWELVSSKIDEHWELPPCESITADVPGLPAPYSNHRATKLTSSDK